MPALVPVVKAVSPLKVLAPDALEQGRNVLGRGRKVLDPDDALEDGGGVRVLGRDRDDTRAVDQVDAPHEGDVLPDLSLSWDGRDRADLLLLERVDDRRLADVRVADEAHRDLLLVRVEDRELTEELDERTLPERVVDRGVEGERRRELRQVLDPASLRRGCRNKSQRDVEQGSRPKRRGEKTENYGGEGDVWSKTKILGLGIARPLGVG